MKKNIFIFIIALTLILTACGSGDSDTNTTSEEIGTLETVPADFAGKTNPLGADAATDGAMVFKTNCETCHGVQGHGNGPISEALDPKPKNLAELQAVATDDYLFWRIAEGKPGTSMPPWKNILTEDQVWQVVTFVRTLK